MGKEAVVVIIDANSTMSQPVVRSEKEEKNTNNNMKKKSRLDCAKEVAIAMISDLMIQSKTNEVTVIVLHTAESRNFLCMGDHDEADDDNDEQEDHKNDNNTFSNMMEFSGNGESMGIQRPTPDLLRKIHTLQVTESSSKKMKGGDFVAGIVYAADALHQRTASKKYLRRIILLTDAEHKVTTNPKLLLVALDSLRAMETRLEVVGMNFEYEEDFDDAAVAQVKQEDMSDGNDQAKDGGEHPDDGDDGSETDLSGDEDDEDSLTVVKQQNERYLLSLANKTGGFVFAAKELHSMLDKILGRRVIVPSKRKLQFEIAPGKILEDARYYLLLSKASTATLKKKVVEVDENNEPKKNSLGIEMVDDYVTNLQHWDASGDEVPWDQVSRAFRFGADLLPFNDIDDAGLMQPSPVKLTILGYMDTRQVPEYLRVGPPYVLSGNDSRRCCAAISALARALKRTGKVAIATFVKTKDKDPILCGLFPLEEQEDPLHLIIMQLPFSGDIRYFPELPSLDGILIKNAARVSDAADEMIESMMLPQETLDYRRVANPKIRSFYKTVVGRVFDRRAPVVGVRNDEDGHDKMGTPVEIEKTAQPAVTTFYSSLPLKKVDKDAA